MKFEDRYMGGRPKFDFRTTSTENYKSFKRDNPTLKYSITVWRKLLLSYTQLYKEYALETGDMMDIPSECGKLAIKKKKPRKHIVDPKTGKVHINLPIDWKRSKELKKRVYMMNHHTDGYMFQWKWFDRMLRSTNVKFGCIWKFTAMKDANRLLNHYLNADDKYQHIYKEWLNRK